MAIIETIDESLFISRFEDYKRVVTDENKNGNFTYEGLRNLYAYLDELSDDCDKPLELDVVALCCDYSEYADLNEYLQNYPIEKEEDETDQEFKERVEEEINDNTTLIKFGSDLDEGFIIQAY